MKKPILLAVLPVCILITNLSVSTCDKPFDPADSIDQTWETASGTVTLIDASPLYTIEYTADYRFDDYLRTGSMPFAFAEHTDSARFSCTCFSAFGDGSRLLGRNYDWDDPSVTYLVFTDPPDGYASAATVDLSFFAYNAQEAPDHSANENTLRRLPYFPFDGMNERGVAVGMNALNSAVSPFDPSKVTIGELQAIRLVLDYAASTDEAIGLFRQYNIRMENPPIHYLIADSSGHSVIIEFVNGNMEVMHNPDPWQVTTNFIITNLSRPEDASCWRYRTAYNQLKLKNGLFAADDAKDLLQAVSVTITRWSTVYDLTTGRLQIARGRYYETFHSFSVPWAAR